MRNNKFGDTKLKIFAHTLNTHMYIHTISLQTPRTFKNSMRFVFIHRLLCFKYFVNNAGKTHVHIHTYIKIL